MQFTAPFVADIVGEAVAAGTEHIVALPLYPLCGASTTVAALEALHAAVAASAGSGGRPAPRVTDLAGWHPHRGFVEAVAESTAAAAREGGLELNEAGTLLYFSAHGTPLKYLREGSRYDRYVEELCAMVAGRLAVEDYAIGYQNHANRGIEWTAPSNEDLLPTLEATRLLVVPISFVHEQSETLVELDEDFKELAESLGKEMTRVPVPFDAPALVGALADLVEPFLRAGDARAEPGDSGPDGRGALRRCQCRPGPNAWCLNGDRPRGRLV